MILSKDTYQQWKDTNWLGSKSPLLFFFTSLTVFQGAVLEFAPFMRIDRLEQLALRNSQILMLMAPHTQSGSFNLMFITREGKF